MKSHIITDEGSVVVENGGFPALLLLFKYTFPFVLSFGFQGVDEAGRYILPFGTSLPSVSAVCARLVSIFIVGLLVSCVFTRYFVRVKWCAKLRLFYVSVYCLLGGPASLMYYSLRLSYVSERRRYLLLRVHASPRYIIVRRETPSTSLRDVHVDVSY